MTVDANNTFERCKQENIDRFDFQRVITAIRATRFGWGRHAADKSDDWFLQRAIGFAADVMDSAFNYAQEVNGEAWSECGGFRATARPNGRVMLQFVLESSWNDLWDEDDEPENVSQPVPAQNHAPVVVTGRRRILKLHVDKEL